MMNKVLIAVALLPLAMCWPTQMSWNDKEKMFMDMMKGGEKKEDDGGSKQMMEYMKMMMQKKEHYAGDADGCKEGGEQDKMKDWMKKMEEEEKQKKTMKEMYEFKKYMEHKKEMEAKYMEEQQKKMMEMYQKHKQMQEKEAKEREFQDMIDAFQDTKHKFAFKLTHEMLKLCKCGEISDQMNRIMGQSGADKNMTKNMTKNMMEEDAEQAMLSGDMETLAMKYKEMSTEERKKLFMAGMIQSMCGGAKTFVTHMKNFEEQYMTGSFNGTLTKSNSTTTQP